MVLASLEPQIYTHPLSPSIRSLQIASNSRNIGQTPTKEVHLNEEMGEGKEEEKSQGNGEKWGGGEGVEGGKKKKKGPQDKRRTQRRHNRRKRGRGERTGKGRNGKRRW